MAIQTLNNNVALLEQRTKINANFSELDARATTAQTTAGSTATRTRLHTANPSGVIIKSTATANTLAVSGS